jgi:hypothetical protein
MRIIWKDILSLNSRLSLPVKIAGIGSVVALIVWAWYQGAEYWAERVDTKWRSNPQRGGIVGVALAIALLLYLLSVMDRYRRSR